MIPKEINASDGGLDGHRDGSAKMIAHGSWLIAQGPDLRAAGPAPLSHEPRAMGYELCASIQTQDDHLNR